MFIFVKQIFAKLHASHQSWKKNKCSDIIYSILINFIIYNTIQFKSIQNPIKLRNNCKKWKTKEENNPRLS